MEGIKVTLCPNIEQDIQSFTFDELGITNFEWDQLNEDDRALLILDNIMENICSAIDSIEDY